MTIQFTDKVDTTLPKTNIAPENRPSQKETIVFQLSMFRGKLAVSFREGNYHVCHQVSFFECVEGMRSPNLNGFSIKQDNSQWIVP